MPKISVKALLLFVTPALYFDAAEQRVPLLPGILYNLVKVPVRQLRLQVLSGISAGSVGNTDFHQHRILRFVQHNQIVTAAAILLQRLDFCIQLDVEKDSRGFWAAFRRLVDNAARQN